MNWGKLQITKLSIQNIIESNFIYRSKCLLRYYTKIMHIYCKVPSSTEERLAIAKGFEVKWNYLLSLGAIDGKSSFKSQQTVVHIILITNIHIQSHY